VSKSGFSRMSPLLFILRPSSFILALVLASSALAQDHEKLSVDPNFDKAFRDALGYVRAQESYRVDGSVVVRYQLGDTKQEIPYNVKAGMKQPNGLSITSTEPFGGKVKSRMVFHGNQRQADAYFPRESRFSMSPSAAGQFPEMVAAVAPWTLGRLLQDTSVDRWFSMMHTAEYIGLEKIGGVELHHIKCTLYRFELLRDLDIHLWIQTGDTPLITRLMLDLTRCLQGQMLGALAKEGATIEIEIDFGQWDLKAEPPEEEFDAPGNPQEFENIPVADMMAAGSLPFADTLRAQGVKPTAGPSRVTTAQREKAIEQLKKASPAERARLVSQIRAQAGRAGVSSAEIHRLQTQAGHQRAPSRESRSPDRPLH